MLPKTMLTLGQSLRRTDKALKLRGKMPKQGNRLQVKENLTGETPRAVCCIYSRRGHECAASAISCV